MIKYTQQIMQIANRSVVSVVRSGKGQKARGNRLAVDVLDVDKVVRLQYELAVRSA